MPTPIRFVDFIRKKSSTHPMDRIDEMWDMEKFQQRTRDEATHFQEELQVGDWLEELQDFAPYTPEGLRKLKFR